MLRSSRSVLVKTYNLPSSGEKTFKLTMASERRILAVQLEGSHYVLLVEEPKGSSSQDFDFIAAVAGEVFVKPNDYSYLGTYNVVTDPDADRPSSEARYLYGKERGESMGGAL